MSTNGKFDSDFGFTRLGTVFTNILSADVLDDEFSVGIIGDGFVFQDAENVIKEQSFKKKSYLKLAELISCDPLNHLHSAEASFMTHSKTSIPASLPLTDFGQVWKASVFSAAVTIIFGAP